MEGFSSPGSKFYLGLDIGSISIKTVVLDACGELQRQNYVRHHGRPFDTIEQILRELTAEFNPKSFAPPVITGTAATELATLLHGEAVGEVMALTMAADTLDDKPGCLIDIGGEDTKILWFRQEGNKLSLSDFAMNAMCAAGTGSFLDQQSHRLNYNIEEFGQLALKSQVPPRVAGRCSVFAKSDMIHLQQSPLQIMKSYTAYV